jgi:ssDNA-binding Zn-finger/Zn-ribbon topoisomerase 1
MPFCRKCGRRLLPYSKSCPECKTSTTGPLINIKKASAAKSFKTTAPTKIAKAMVPDRDVIITIEVIEPTKSIKAVAPAKATVTRANSNSPSSPSKPVVSTEVYPTHEIKQSNISLKEDIIKNRHDYEKQAFVFDLRCPKGHFWRSGKPLPVSNGKAFCPKCGEPLKKPKPKEKRITYHRF